MERFCIGNRCSLTPSRTTVRAVFHPPKPPMSLDLQRLRHPLGLALAILLVSWLLALAAGPGLLHLVGVSLPPDGHAVVHAHGHPFIDARNWLGIPKTLDVLSNLGFIVVAVLVWRRAPGAPWPAAWRALAVALLLTALGSGAYHWAPGPWGLLLDRAGMAAAFAVVLSIAVAERLSPKVAVSIGAVLLAAGGMSALLAWSQAQVLPWAVLQFGGLLCLMVAAIARPLAPHAAVHWGALVGMYALAKVFELTDALVYEATQGLLAGHALKHLVAAAAVWPIAAAGLRQNAPSRARGARAA